MDEGINVLSLFDGMSCGRIALERAGIKVKNYYACEIDKYAITVSKANYPDIIQLGSVVDTHGWLLPKMDLIIGGSPCQGFSYMGRQLNFKDPRSVLFFEYVRILKECREENPDIKFMLENVSMREEYEKIINEHLGVKALKINASAFSSQNRLRLFWTDIRQNIPLPNARNIPRLGFLDLLPDTNNDQPAVVSRLLKTNTGWKVPQRNGYVEVGDGDVIDLSIIASKTRGGRLMRDKMHCLLKKEPSMYRIVGEKFIRFSPTECERLQCVPENYTKAVSNTQRYYMLGNGWNVDVITHIFNYLDELY